MNWESQLLLCFNLWLNLCINYDLKLWFMNCESHFSWSIYILCQWLSTHSNKSLLLTTRNLLQVLQQYNSCFSHRWKCLSLVYWRAYMRMFVCPPLPPLFLPPFLPLLVVLLEVQKWYGLERWRGNFSTCSLSKLP